METGKPDWARTEYVCVCGKKFYRSEPAQKRCGACTAKAAKEHARGREIYERAVKAFCDVLRAEMHEEEARALADTSNTEKGLFICDDGSGVGFVFHSIFGVLLTSEQVKNIEAQASQEPIHVGLRELLHGGQLFPEESEEDPLTGEERGEAQ